MNKKVIGLVVQLKQNNNYIVQGINQNDIGVIFDIKIMDGLEAFDFSGYGVVALKIQKPDGTFTIDSNAGTYLDIINPVTGRLKINIPTSCTAQNGMHFCSVTFGQNLDSVFATMSFNYFVGTDPNPDNEDVSGTEEFPILVSLIGQCSDAVTNEEGRRSAEEERQQNEADREAEFASMSAQLQELIVSCDRLEHTVNDLVYDIYHALASGGTIDVSQLSALATKAWTNTRLEQLDYNNIQGALQIRHESEVSSSNLYPGELGWDTDTNQLYVGDTLNHPVLINSPSYIFSSVAPTDHGKLWVDGSYGAGILKYWDTRDDDWVACNVAVFG